MKRILIAYFIISLFAVYVVGLYKYISTEQAEWSAIKPAEPLATDFLVDFKMGWVIFKTWSKLKRQGKVIAISRISYIIKQPVVIWTIWSNNLDGLRFTEWGKYIIWRTK